MCLDVCPPAGVAARGARGGGAADDALGGAPASTRRARRASCASASRRAAPTRELRRRSIEEIAALGFDGYALGGLAVGEEPRGDARRRSAGRRRCCRPTGRATSWASATPRASSSVIARGIDMFDCVLPTRTARTGSALTGDGRLNLRNARYARDPRPLEEGCACPACTRVLARLHPSPRQPGGDPRAAAPHSA